ncbi:unnamed protein product, partial [Schistosoma mattheei]
MQHIECYNFNCLPFARTIDFSEFARSIAGYWSRTPFWEGDPCEFGLLGVLDLNRSECVRNEISCSGLPDNVKNNILIRHGIAEGVLTAFAWASAQAYNQGFTLYNELTYPLCVQLILMDGNYIQLLRFQLNSITSLWKAEDSMLPYNLAWYSPRVELCKLQSDLEHNETFTVNNEAISLLTSAMLHPVDKITSSESLRPYLADGMAPRNYLIDKSSAKHLIPSSEEDKYYHEKFGDMTKLQLSETEMNALRSSGELNKSKKSTRLYTSKRPHPNDIFYFKSSGVMLPSSTGLYNRCVPTFTETDVRRCLQSLNSSGCLGPDGIPNILFKKCADVLCYPFTTIINRSFSSNLIPKMWRKMKIIPVPKKASGDKH